MGALIPLVSACSVPVRDSRVQPARASASVGDPPRPMHVRRIAALAPVSGLDGASATAAGLVSAPSARADASRAYAAAASLLAPAYLRRVALSA
jgi:hypothetical protein